jgi:hypothetical protein
MSRPEVASALPGWDPVPVLLRLLREPRTGRPAPIARLVALVVALGLLAVSAPVLLPVVRWFLALL